MCAASLNRSNNKLLFTHRITTLECHKTIDKHELMCERVNDGRPEPTNSWFQWINMQWKKIYGRKKTHTKNAQHKWIRRRKNKICVWCVLRVVCCVCGQCSASAKKRRIKNKKNIEKRNINVCCVFDIERWWSVEIVDRRSEFIAIKTTTNIIL